MIKTGYKQLGSGGYTTAFSNGGRNVMLISCDPVKMHMAQGNFPDHSLFPKVKLLGEFNEGVLVDHYLYSMPFLKTFKGIDRAGLKAHLNRRQYKFLCALQDNMGFRDGYNDINCGINDLPCEFEKEKNILRRALDSFDINITFEMEYFNIAGKNGKLILMDCFYSNDAEHTELWAVESAVKNLQRRGLTLWNNPIKWNA